MACKDNNASQFPGVRLLHMDFEVTRTTLKSSCAFTVLYANGASVQVLVLTNRQWERGEIIHGHVVSAASAGINAFGIFFRFRIFDLFACVTGDGPLPTPLITKLRFQ